MNVRSESSKAPAEKPALTTSVDSDSDHDVTLKVLKLPVDQDPDNLLTEGNSPKPHLKFSELYISRTSSEEEHDVYTKTDSNAREKKPTKQDKGKGKEKERRRLSPEKEIPRRAEQAMSLELQRQGQTLADSDDSDEEGSAQAWRNSIALDRGWSSSTAGAGGGGSWGSYGSGEKTLSTSPKSTFWIETASPKTRKEWETKEKEGNSGSPVVDDGAGSDDDSDDAKPAKSIFGTPTKVCYLWRLC